MSFRTSSRTRLVRRGAAVVEMAVVLSLFLLVLFGVLEYSRLLFMRQVADNACREGARYAVVNTYSPTVDADAINVVNNYMAGMQSGLSNYSVELFAGDADGNNIGPASDATFGQYIVVQVEFDYSPVLPEFLFLGATFKIRGRALMNSEAN